ncbi:hypothetical protein, partial [Neisseria gonorrhoeae]|uniref:hypothetical protein n=1 Tax=Neisseria gonorrhoeae TaxID=485 RepID=UPI001C59BAD5
GGHQTVPIVRNRFTWCFSTLEIRSLCAKAVQRRTVLKLIHYTLPVITVPFLLKLVYDSGTNVVYNI